MIGVGPSEEMVDKEPGDSLLLVFRLDKANFLKKLVKYPGVAPGFIFLLIKAQYYTQSSGLTLIEVYPILNFSFHQEFLSVQLQISYLLF